MAWIAIITALTAAAMNAGASVLQRLATGTPDPLVLFSRQFAREVTLERLFLAGLGLQILAFLTQAVALAKGSLTVVEPLLTTDLVFLLVFIYWKTRVRAGLREWLGVAAIIAGLSLLFVVAQPSGGHARYAFLPWAITIAAVGMLVLFTALTIRHLPKPSLRGLLAGLAAAATFALNAALTKLMLSQLQGGGVAQVVGSWPVYALIGSGIVSLFVMQNAYGAGPLAITQPIMEILEPAFSVTIGITIFGDSVTHTASALAAEAAGVAVLIGGILALATSARIHQAGQRGI